MKRNPEHERLVLFVKNLPKEPGVYRYYDKDEKILYIGKAKNLKHRVSSYFSNTAAHSNRIRKMVSQIFEIKYTVVNTEMEALLLENNLIKQYQPKYNILLKDGKSYPYVVIKKEAFPRVFQTRKKITDGSTYFGPFPNQKSLNDIMNIINDNFKFRSCSLNLSQENINAEKFKVCLEYQIGNCKAPCVGKEKEDDYEEKIKEVKKILTGNYHGITKRLEVDMKSAASEYEFEKAEELRKKIAGINSFIKKNTIFSETLSELEVLAIKKKDALAILTHFKIKNGTIIQTHSWEIKKCKEETERDLILMGIDQLLLRSSNSGGELILNIDPEKAKISPFSKIHIPKLGDKKKLIDLAIKNCLTLLKEKTLIQNNAKFDKDEIILTQLQKDLKLKKLPNWIECMDNSNIQGTNPVASVVVFKKGKASKKDYRKFKIKTVVGPDDFASMKEIMLRRYSRLVKEGNGLPDLIIVDGGKGQLSSAYTVLQELNLHEKIPLLGIAKKLEEIFYVNDPIPLHLDKRSPSLKLIQRLRNEAHRFAITFHRDLRSKNEIATQLTAIKGIGEKTSKNLLIHYGSISKLKAAGFRSWKKNFGLSVATKLKSL